jgi:hypothetical protein
MTLSSEATVAKIFTSPVLMKTVGSETLISKPALTRLIAEEVFSTFIRRES